MRDPNRGAKCRAACLEARRQTNTQFGTHHTVLAAMVLRLSDKEAWNIATPEGWNILLAWHKAFLVTLGRDPFSGDMRPKEIVAAKTARTKTAAFFGLHPVELGTQKYHKKLRRDDS